ncbi:LysR family transcriptional regulator [Gluconacetobacter azotocaptans]|uniref:LysR family transcriptional regulator n=1 Tax=Gluconacetobacter azotocaptans TaxID=142834 RepID=UPI00195751F7|nr:LysR family transcriptional regulator [Gluconacetobacter azotocaptans]MBM9402554.1 LysR family transcriptional regulator [Gluconacetobacter azotocaptans]
MELPALIYFTSLINEGSAASAASALGVSASTLNHSVSALEQAMATSLLSRSALRRGSKTITTAHGESLYRSALHLLGWSLALIGEDSRASIVPPEEATPHPLPTRRLRALLDSGLTLRMIGYFLSVCETGRIAAAAQRLSLTQPTLSRQIRKLETILGRTLFLRSPHGVTLTAEAESLRQGCQQVDRTYRQIMRDENFSYFREFRTLKLASMMPTSSDSSLTVLLANLVRLWRHRRYQPPLTISTIAAPQMVEGLLDGRFDAGLSDLIDIPLGLDCAELEKSAIFLVSSRSHGLRANQTPQMVLASCLLAVPALGTGLRRITDRYLDQEGIAPSAIFETQSLSLILRLVEDGTCCAILPAGSFRSHAVHAVPLPDRYRMTTRLIWKEDHRNLAIIDRLRAGLAEIQVESTSMGRKSVA